MGVFPTEYVAIEFKLPLLAPKACMPAFPVWLPTNKYFPFGSATRKLGCDSEPNGESVTGTGKPVPEVIEYVEILFDP